MKKKTLEIVGKYGFEFLSIFVALVSAYALDNWKENRKDHFVASKILMEIHNGLGKDMNDIELNELGHKQGLIAETYFQNYLTNIPIDLDSLKYKYFGLLRGFISIQNVSGYETLKSKGLEIIENDSLRSEIISLYEYDFKTLKKLEEDYSELQFHNKYYNDFNELLSPNFEFNQSGSPTRLKPHISLNENDRKKLLLDLWQIKTNRSFILGYYAEVKVKITNLQIAIQKELKK